MSEGYQGLDVYKFSHKLAVKIHAVTMQLPKYELYEEGSQIRRSSKRISASIVEGYAMRKYKAEFLHYLYRAYGSSVETLEHLEYLWETGSYTDADCYHELHALNQSVNRMLFSFIQGVEREHEKPYALQEEAAEYMVEHVEANS